MPAASPSWVAQAHLSKASDVDAPILSVLLIPKQRELSWGSESWWRPGWGHGRKGAWSGRDFSRQVLTRLTHLDPRHLGRCL